MDATYLPENLVVVTLQGMAVGFSFEIFLKYLISSKERRVRIRVLKCFMGLCMGFKLIFFLAMNCALGASSCAVVGRFGDFLYHMSMAFGNAVLLDRVATVVPAHLTKRFTIAHLIISFIRFAIGVVDTAIITVNAASNGSCLYEDNIVWGPVYTFYDTLTDLYVTVCITTILIQHIRKVKNVNLAANINLFIAVGATNVMRTTVLMISNLVSAALILIQERQVVIMITWPIINLFFILLVGHDTDIARLLRKLHRATTQRMNSSRTILTPDPDCHEYNIDKISSTHSAHHSSNSNHNSTYQLQPTNITPIHTSSMVDEERGPWRPPWEEPSFTPSQV